MVDKTFSIERERMEGSSYSAWAIISRAACLDMAAASQINVEIKGTKISDNGVYPITLIIIRLTPT